MTPVELSRTVLCAVRRAVDAGELTVAVPARAVVAAPGPGGSGDYATNIALQLARPAGRTPRYVAEVLCERISAAPGVRGVEITGPGFLNISLDSAAPAALVREILSQGPRYGHGDALAGQLLSVRLPLAYEPRAEVVADAVARIVASQGARVRLHRDTSTQGTLTHGDGGDLGGSGGPGLGILDLRNLPPAPGDPAPLGPDAARWALLHPAPHDRVRVGAEHLVQRESNPLFRVRYAYARTRALGRNAADLGFAAYAGDLDDVPAALHLALADHPRLLLGAATHRAPDRLARHLVTLADATLAFLPTVLPLGDEKPSAAHRARLALAEAAGTVLAGGLSLLGIDAPEYL
ncbi:ArgS-related anticodon-binding protein NrtL [Streptomyces sp. WI04-05B]|uniref:ArgS-related anticodon-binding protein NrtL n=1 Tax=Streptomyces TaxID=1883 RepID=UPI0029B1E029|nr:MULTISPECIES: DALR anticodon-binding domain-containing protein [unclassified Streptomyces]MDX2547335.1 DALR anticodon-binding domain-containing protein [Streptomyces sp. WI04-05B]MDX2589823.1 DALR anticodon-binding domain-containing protein [Streptomyces sp. WI04-05A]MDX3753440.1 DALR anticodon-binding domain-containing protein [Streptomyces sp. AK08-02]